MPVSIYTLATANSLLTDTPIGYIIEAMKGGISLAKECCCHCHDSKERSDKEYKDLITRLNRIAGQVQGVKGMVERNAYCIDILTQVSAITAALNSFNKVLLGNHIRTCVSQDIRDGNDETVEELVATLQKLMR